MKATCPKDPSHKRFITVAHVAEDWLVDDYGNWIETIETTDIVAKPDPGNTWTCQACGAEAKVSR